MQKIIQYKNVELCRKEFTVLKDVNFAIGKGEFIYLIGKVGSGKSTLLKSLYADVPIAHGNAEIMGFNLTKIKRGQIPYLRRSIGFVFQDFKLLADRNVYSNLEFVLKATGWKEKSSRDERIEEVLTAVGMEKKSYKMPHELSGGEQQRIAIARALLNDPDLILADEPTGNLDPETGEQIISRLYNIAQTGTTVIIATHNMSFMERYPGLVLSCKNKRLITENE